MKEIYTLAGATTTATAVWLIALYLLGNDAPFLRSAALFLSGFAVVIFVGLITDYLRIAK